jgi:arylsulfatase A-like enzyme
MPEGKPNILVIWGDDIGITNLSCYSMGMMGYRTPNIDRLANEGRSPGSSSLRSSCATVSRFALIATNASCTVAASMFES